MARLFKHSKSLLLWAILAGPLLWGFLLTPRRVLVVLSTWFGPF
jgi:hypothetical protein